MIINDEIITIKDLIVANSDCEQVYLFGSYAYGTPRGDADPLGPSDYDFYVVLNDHAKNPMLVMQDLNLRWAHLNLDVSWHKKIMPVDFLAHYRSTFEERRKFLTIEHTIAEKGVLLYDKYAPDNPMVYRSAV
jgi:predicted nucleotidyltransferase